MLGLAGDVLYDAVEDNIAYVVCTVVIVESVCPHSTTVYVVINVGGCGVRCPPLIEDSISILYLQELVVLVS